MSWEISLDIIAKGNVPLIVDALYDVGCDAVYRPKEDTYQAYADILDCAITPAQLEKQIEQLAVNIARIFKCEKLWISSLWANRIKISRTQGKGLNGHPQYRTYGIETITWDRQVAGQLPEQHRLTGPAYEDKACCRFMLKDVHVNDFTEVTNEAEACRYIEANPGNAWAIKELVHGGAIAVSEQFVENIILLDE